MRYSFLLIVGLLLLPAIQAATQFDYPAPYGGCCLTGTECIPGDDALFTSEQAFLSACALEQGGSEPQISTGQICQTSCELGCCCAGPTVPTSAEINASEELLRSTQYACVQKSSIALPYTFMSKTGTQSCVQLCAGGRPQSSTYTISGRVLKAGQPARANITFISSNINQPLTTTGAFNQALPANRQYTVTVAPEDTSCRPQSVSVLLDRNINRDFTLDCSPVQGCINRAPEVSTPTLGSGSISFDITYPDTCSNFNTFVPYLCVNNDCQAMGSTTSRNITLPVQPASRYCVYVRAQLTPTGSIASAQRCVDVPNPVCMERTGSWCGSASDGTSSVLSCNAQGRLSEQRCASGQICQGGANPQCVERTDCAKCNGLLGLFARLNIHIPFGETFLLCGRDTQQCYVEQTFVPSYQHCTGVKDCSNYTSAQSCNADGCGIDACEWKPTDSELPVVEELGRGVCTSPAKPACRKCNEAFDQCTKELCESIGDCYFDGPVAGTGGSNDYRIQWCIPRTEMACRFYDNAADCGSSSVNIQYNPSGARDGGTNARTVTTPDKYGFGVCKWISNVNRCVKDADNRMVANEDDCLEAGFRDARLQECLTDNTPPTTEFFLKNPPVYGSSEIGNLPFRVNESNTITYACVNTTTAPCYPRLRIDQLSVPDVNADYKIYYYSIDSNFNSEQVRFIDIRVRKDNVTRLSNVTIEESER